MSVKFFLKQCKGIVNFPDTSRKGVLYCVRNALLKRCKGILSYGFTDPSRKVVLYYVRNKVL